MTTGIGMRKAGPTVIGPAGKAGPTEFGPAGGHGAHTAKGLDRRPPGTCHSIAGYTDAMYDANKTRTGMVGIVIYDPEDPVSK